MFKVWRQLFRVTTGGGLAIPTGTKKVKHKTENRYDISDIKKTQSPPGREDTEAGGEGETGSLNVEGIPKTSFSKPFEKQMRTEGLPQKEIWIFFELRILCSPQPWTDTICIRQVDINRIKI